MKFEDLKKCLKENDLMKNQNVIDICASFSSRHNHLKYKIEGNSAIYEDGTIIKFILNDDNEIEYYIINNQGDMSNVYPIYNHKLLDLTESENYVINYETGNKESTDGMWIFEYYGNLKDAKGVKEAHIKAGYKSFIQYVPQEYAVWVSWEPILRESEIDEADTDDIDWSQHPEKDKPFIEQGKCPYCTGPITKEEYKLYGMCSTCWDNNVE